MIPVRIANPPSDLMQKFHPTQLDFYHLQAKFIAKILGDPQFQKFLENCVIKKEDIPRNKIKEIAIMRLPSKKYRKSLGLAARYNVKTYQIRIYPYKVKDDPKEPITSKDRVPTPLAFLKRVIRAIIHEVLHAKYNRDYARKKGLTEEELERVVMKLEERYFRLALTSLTALQVNDI